MTAKHKILMISDHPLSTSGVGVQARFLIHGLLSTGRYSFKCFGAALKHDNLDQVTVNPDFVIKPINGFGDKMLIRQAIMQERPDALLLFTDPRFFIHVWEIEDEIHQVCPIVYNHLWDNPPTPVFNQVLYESTDLINCINHPTYVMVKELLPHRHDDVNYIPHAVPPDLYMPLPDADVVQHRKRLFSDRVDHFIALFVSRNARRKMPSDILAAWKVFLDKVQATHGHKKATILMHTDPLDHEGTNLHHVIDMLGITDNVVFSKDRIEFQQMNTLYNVSDVVVNFSSAEGFGLGILEGKMAGKPVIAMKTGGLTRQVEDHETGFQFGVGIDPEVSSMVGNQLVPYIYEHLASHKTLADAFTKVYEMGHEERKRIGRLAREHALKHYNIGSLVADWDRTLSGAIEKWKRGESTNNKRWEQLEL